MLTEINRGAFDTGDWIASLTYRSEAAVPTAPEELDAMLRSARARNHSAGITGMLVYDKGRYFQTLEGPPAALDQIWSSIRQDPRHRSIEVMSRHIGPARLFSEWDMQLISRAVARDRRSLPARDGTAPLTALVPDVVRLVVASDNRGLKDLTDKLVAAGWVSETLIRHLLEPAARRLGDVFLADDCSEIDLTLGLGMLQIAGHAVHEHPSMPGPGRPSPYCVVCVPAPGEPHLLGPSLLSDLFINAGWAVEIAFPATDAALARLRETIDACRAADLKSPVIISVGGRAFAEFGATDKSVGADHARSSAAGAISSLSKLVRHSRLD